MSLYDVLFTLPLVFGVLLVFAMALGLSDVDGGHDLHDLHGDADLHHGLLDSLGVGRVPLMVVALLLLFTFGGVGVVFHPLLARLLGENLGFFATWLIAGFSALLVTHSLGRVVARVLPGVESYASSKQELIGQVGTVVVCVEARDLVVRVRDEGGAELRVRAAIAADRETARSGARVLLTAYDSARDRYRAELVTLD